MVSFSPARVCCHIVRIVDALWATLSDDFEPRWRSQWNGLVWNHCRMLYLLLELEFIQAIEIRNVRRTLGPDISIEISYSWKLFASYAYFGFVML